MLGEDKNPGNVLKDVASRRVSFKAMVLTEFGASEKRWKTRGSFRRKQDKEVQKERVSSSLEMATEPERHGGAAVSEAAIDGDRVSHAGAAPGREEDGDGRE